MLGFWIAPRVTRTSCSIGGNEAIIYSISDAVLVTDPFDDLVLANEAAARSFDFDLATSSRLTIGERVSRLCRARLGRRRTRSRCA